jgi:hypothetical protein
MWSIAAVSNYTVTHRLAKSGFQGCDCTNTCMASNCSLGRCMCDLLARVQKEAVSTRICMYITYHDICTIMSRLSFANRASSQYRILAASSPQRTRPKEVQFIPCMADTCNARAAVMVMNWLAEVLTNDNQGIGCAANLASVRVCCMQPAAVLLGPARRDLRSSRSGRDPLSHLWFQHRAASADVPNSLEPDI